VKSEDPRWWLGIGAVVGLGMMTKYTIVFFIAGLMGGVIFTRNRQYLSSPWLWGGAALSLLIFAPNLYWQVQHNFISLEFLSSIHARDVEIGRTQGYLIEQFVVASNPFTVAFWLSGLAYLFLKPAGERYRMLGWMYAIPFVLLLFAQGRSYYLAPAYPMLIAAGVVVREQRFSPLASGKPRLARRSTWGALAAAAVLFIPVMLPVAPINSALWKISSQMHDNFLEQIGWTELVEEVAGIYHALPGEEQPRTAVLAGNYGEAGAINLYGPAYGMAGAISGRNSYWLRGYGDPPPETLIVLGFSREAAERVFTRCELAGRVTNRYAVANEESTFHPDIYLCRGPRQPWPLLWEDLKSFS
jgi:4-amino-4-deoxy-L-arabinose transferase-like glycosyltransferase